MKSVLIQGATGSIGTSALDVLSEQSGEFRVAGLSAGIRQEELLKLAQIWRPDSLALQIPRDAQEFESAAMKLGIKRVFIGQDAAQTQADQTDYDILLNATVGGAGILSTLAALNRGRKVALANKETLVAAGELVMQTARENQAQLVPIDSEHSAILQCLAGESSSSIRTLWLTTSGGPFWGKSKGELENVTPEDALRHPTWQMGAKITVDSSTLFNKGLEVIEACKLFGLPPERVKVVRQRESVVHSMVEFSDGSFKAQLSRPDMRLPILYALGYPNRLESSLVQGSPSEWTCLHFDEVNIEEFPCLRLAYEALECGGAAPCVISAADEVAVAAFLDRRLSFNAIADVIEETMNTVTKRGADNLDDILKSDHEARLKARESCDARNLRRGAACS